MNVIDRLCAWWLRCRGYTVNNPGVRVYQAIMTNDFSRGVVFPETKWHRSPSYDPRDNMRAQVHKVPHRNAFGGIPIEDERSNSDE